MVARAMASPNSHHDSPHFRRLATKTAEDFHVRRMVAGMVYSSRLNRPAPDDPFHGLTVDHEV